MPHNQDNDRADHRDQQAIKIQTGYARVAELIEKPATYYRADDTEDDIQQQSFAGFVYDLTADKSRQRPRTTQAKIVIRNLLVPMRRLIAGVDPIGSVGRVLRWNAPWIPTP